MKNTLLFFSAILSISCLMATERKTSSNKKEIICKMSWTNNGSFDHPTWFNADTISPANFMSNRLNAFSTKAVRHFEKYFKNASKKQWYILQDGFIVYFVEEGVEKKAAYNESGKWLHTLFFYRNNRLPARVGRVVGDAYLAYTASLVVEIQKFDQTLYLVKMENSHELITVRISNDEMEEIENFRKAIN